MYKTEKDFVKAFQRALRHTGLDMIRIESHSTINGIPDAFIQGHGFDCWIEFKNDLKLEGNKQVISVPWRAGQQGWYANYFAKHDYKRCVLTLMSCKDGVYFIPNLGIHKNNMTRDGTFVSFEELARLSSKQICIILDELTSLSRVYDEWEPFLVDWIQQYYPDLDFDVKVLLDSCGIDYNIVDSVAFQISKLKLLMELFKYEQIQNQQKLNDYFDHSAD